MIYFVILFALLVGGTVWLSRKYSYIESVLLVSSIAIAFDWSVSIGERARPTMNDAIFLLCCLVWGLKIVQTRDMFRFPKKVVMIVLSGSFLFLWSTLTWVVHPGNESLVFGVWRGSRVFVHIVYILLGAQLIYTSEFVQKRVVHILMLGGVLNSLIGFVQTMSGGQYLHGFWTNGRYLGLLSPLPTRQLLSRTKGIRLEPDQFINRLERASGTTLHSDWLAPYIVLIACLWLGFAIRSKNNRHRLIYLVGFAICVGGLIASANRSGFLALAAGIIYIVIIRPIWLFMLVTPIRRYALLFTILIIVALGARSLSQSGDTQQSSGISRAYTRIITIFDLEQTQISNLNGRLALWTFAWDKITETPLTMLLGTGDEPTRGDVWNGEDSGLFLPLHNVYLYFLFSNGFPALFIFLGLFIFVIYMSHIISKQNGLLGQIATGLHIGSIALAVNGIGIDWISFASTYTAAVYLILTTYTFCLFALKLELKTPTLSSQLISKTLYEHA